MATNKERARRFFEDVWADGDLSAVDELFADDVEFDPTVGDTTAEGIEEVKLFIESSRASLSDVDVTIEEQVSEGGIVFTRWSATGTYEDGGSGVPDGAMGDGGALALQSRATGEQVKLEGTTTFEFEDGEIVEAESDWDSMDLLEQVNDGDELVFEEVDEFEMALLQET